MRHLLLVAAAVAATCVAGCTSDAQPTASVSPKAVVTPSTNRPTTPEPSANASTRVDASTDFSAVPSSTSATVLGNLIGCTDVSRRSAVDLPPGFPKPIQDIQCTAPEGPLQIASYKSVTDVSRTATKLTSYLPAGGTIYYVTGGRWVVSYKPDDNADVRDAVIKRKYLTVARAVRSDIGGTLVRIGT